MAIKGTKIVSHSGLGKMPRKGPAGSPHGSMGKALASVNNTDQKNLRVHGGTAGGPSRVKVPKVTTHLETLRESAAGYGKK